jgi:hypothetical protein
MTMAVHDDSKREAAMETLAASAGTDPASLVLLASWFLETSEFPRAADFLIRASAANLPREIRSLVDSSLAQLGTEPSLSESAAAAARDAALRLRRDARSPLQRQTLAAILRNLGLEKEALALSPLPPGLASHTNVRPAASQGNPPDSSKDSRFSPTRINELIAAGNQPDAINLLVSSALADATTITADAATAPGFWNRLPDPILAWLASVSDHGLTAEVSAALAAADSNPLARGTALSWLRQDTLAKPLLEKALSGPPSTHESAHAKLFAFAIHQLDAPAAAAHLLAISDAHRMNAWVLASSPVNWKPTDPKPYAAACHETLRRIIPSLPPDSSEWIAAAVYSVVDFDPETRNAVARELYPLVCRFPKAASRAFGFLSFRHPQTSAAILADAAIAATIATASLPQPPAKPDESFWPVWPLDLIGWRYPVTSWTSLAAAAIRESWRDNKAASLDVSLASKIASTGRAAAARRLIALYTADPDNFSAACRDFLSADPHPSSWSIVAVAATDRQIVPDLSSALDAILNPPVDSNSYPLATTAAAALASITAATKGPEAATAFLDSLALRLLGPPDSRASRLATVRWNRVNNTSTTPRPEEAGPFLFVSTLVRCTKDSAAAITPALNALHKHVIPLVPENIRANCLKRWSADFDVLTEAVASGDPTKLAATIRRAGFLSDSSLTIFPDTTHPIDPLRALLNDQNSDYLAATNALLSSDPDSLARRLIAALLSDDDSATTNAIAAIAAAQPGSATAWARIFNEWSISTDEATVSPETNAFLASARQIAADAQTAASNSSLTKLRNLKSPRDITADDASSAIREILSTAVLAGKPKVDESLAVCLHAASIIDSQILDDALEDALTTPRDPEPRALMLACVARAASAPDLRFSHRPDPDAIAAFLTTTASNPDSPWLWNGSFPGAEFLTNRGDRLALLPGALHYFIKSDDRPRFQSWFTGTDSWESILADPSIALRCRLHAAISLAESSFSSPALRAIATDLYLKFAASSPADGDLAVSISFTAALDPLPTDLARRLLRQITPILLDSSNRDDAYLSNAFRIALDANEPGRASAILREIVNQGSASCAAIATIARNATLLNTALSDWSFDSPLAVLPTPAAALEPDSLAWLATAIPDPARRWHLSAHWAAAAASNPAAIALLSNLASRWPEAALTAPSDRLFALSLLAAWPPALTLLPDSALPKSLATPAGSSPDDKAFAAHLLDHTIRIARGDLSLIDLPQDTLDRIDSLDDQRVPRRFLAAVLFQFPNLPADRRAAILTHWSTLSNTQPEAIALMRALNPDDPCTPLSARRHESPLLLWPFPFALWPFPLPDNFDRAAFSSRLHRILAHHADRDAIDAWITCQLAANPPKP